ncbi:MAG: hypothetical protein AAF317_06125 [Pseudomonadota bacterium]
MLTKLSLVSVFILGSAGVAFADTVDTFVAVDTNADEKISLGEFQQAYPELNTEIFAQLDQNADAALTAEEFIGSNLPDIVPSDG